MSEINRKSFISSCAAASLALPFIVSCGGGIFEKSAVCPMIATEKARLEYLKMMLDRLCSNGPSPIGSENNNVNAGIYRQELERTLKYVSLDSFRFSRWNLLSDPVLTVGGKSLETYPGHGTGDTGPDGISGIPVIIGDDKLPKYGIIPEGEDSPKAYISVSPFGRAVPRPYYSFGFAPGGPAVFNIGIPDIPVLDKAVEDKTPVFLKDQIEFRDNTPASNVVGRIAGKTEDEIVILAHFDTVYNAPGANDNTASAIALLMLAHYFSNRILDMSLTFLFTNGEEYGKLGAEHYAQFRKSEGTLGRIRYLINFDSLTWGPNLRIATAHEDLMEMVTAIDKKLGANGTPFLETDEGYVLDNLPFKEAGATAQAIYFNSTGYNITNLWHRPEDVPENVPLDCIESSFLVISEFIEKLASS